MAAAWFAAAVSGGTMAAAWFAAAVSGGKMAVAWFAAGGAMDFVTTEAAAVFTDRAAVQDVAVAANAVGRQMKQLRL